MSMNVCLLKDLCLTQVALEAHLARSAESATHRTANLRADARRAAVVIVRHEDRLDERTIRALPQPLLRAVRRDLLLGDGQFAERRVLGELGPQALWQVVHMVVRSASLFIDPLPQLLGAKCRLLPLLEERRRLFGRQRIEVDCLRAAAATVYRAGRTGAVCSTSPEQGASPAHTASESAYPRNPAQAGGHTDQSQRAV